MKDRRWRGGRIASHRGIESATGRLLVGCAIVTLLVGCDPELKIRGNFERVIGDHVTVELVEGSGSFLPTDSIELVDAVGRRFSGAALDSPGADDTEKQVSFVVPIGAAVGRARVSIPRRNDPSPFSLDLHLTRLIVGLDHAGNVTTYPLASESNGIASASVPTSAPVKAMSLSPRAGTLAVLTTNDNVEGFAMGSEVTSLGAGRSVPGAVAVAATERGALVATGDALLIISFGAEGAIVEATLPVQHPVAIAVDEKSEHATLLTYCTVGTATEAGDCVVQAQLAGVNSKLVGSPFQVDATADATLIACRADASAAVIPDPTVQADTQHAYIRGVLLNRNPPELKSLEWSATAVTPSGIDRAPSNLGDLFAIADSANNTVWIIGFNATDRNDLQTVATPTVGPTPTSLSFGAGTELYIGADQQVLDLSFGNGQNNLTTVLQANAALAGMTMQH